ncbi:complex I subunit 5 family protein [Litchfieldella xinjiangensis]|uniref:complex I subunit 5 family protein n=1 Tax=Litchfieldella xinjiangensis TaxID=1166948 RepID=UPI0006933055|nr:proton-conducting transporter membrane subunit [Halomonas xinjiangensis]
MITLPESGLSWLLLGMTAIVCLASGVYGVKYLQVEQVEASRARWWLPLLTVLAIGLALVWLFDHLVPIYLALDTAGLSAVLLMRLAGTDAAREASRRYLIFTLSASSLLLVGMLLLYLEHATLALSELDGNELTTRGGVALGLMLSGLLLKAAAFPLHGWMPPAHGSAWTPVSAIHSTLVLKASLYVAVQLWLVLGAGAWHAAQLIGALGMLSIVWGSVMAWQQEDLKRVVAFSTVAQMGYLLLFFPLSTGTGETVTRLAWESTWLLALNHALAKAAMFMAAGNLVLGMGRDDLKGLSGVSTRLPLPLLTLGLAGVSIMGMPPSGGFVAKWLLLHAVFISGQWQWGVALVLGTLLSAAYMFRLFRHCFVDDQESKSRYQSPPLTLDLIALGLALSALFLGLLADWPLSLLRMEGPW